MPSCHFVNDLELAVQDLWAHLPQGNIRCLINSMPDRVAACIAAGDGLKNFEEVSQDEEHTERSSVIVDHVSAIRKMLTDDSRCIYQMIQKELNIGSSVIQTIHDDLHMKKKDEDKHGVGPFPRVLEVGQLVLELERVRRGAAIRSPTSRGVGCLLFRDAGSRDLKHHGLEHPCPLFGNIFLFRFDIYKRK
ncbi:transposable element Tcb2 transposase [Trichonephila clavipes]|nr:transposable element Tcb2 transposase [Trichonephila clavipes]